MPGTCHRLAPNNQKRSVYWTFVDSLARRDGGGTDYRHWVHARAGRSGPSVTQDAGDCGDGVPVSRGVRKPKEPVQPAEEAERLHMGPVLAGNGPVLPLKGLYQTF